MADDVNPLRHPMTALVDKSVSAAEWLQNADQYKAAIQVARMCATQVDELTEEARAKGTDPDILRQTHMRVLPNLAKALHALGLTPEGYARMTGVSGGAGREGKDAPAETGPFGAAATDPQAEMDALIAEAENVVSMKRPGS